MTAHFAARRLAWSSIAAAFAVIGPAGVLLSLAEPASAQGLPPGIDEAELESRIVSNLTIDLPSLLPPGTLIVDNFCYQDTIFGCTGRVDADISGAPPPYLRGTNVEVTATDPVAVDITLHDIAVKVDVVAVTGIGFSCTIDVSAATSHVIASLSLVEVPGSHSIDATQLGGVSVSFGSFSDTTTCTGFLGGIVEFFIGLFISDLENDFLRPALETYLNAQDGDGNTPIAAAVEIPPVAFIDWVTVGDSGNACDTQSQGCFGSVADAYRISKFEVTNAQYADFLEAVAENDTNALYNTNMGSGIGGIARSGGSGSYRYSAISGREQRPVSYVSFWDATRFANWLHNGRRTGAQDDTTTEDGAYTLTPTGISNNTVVRNAGADVFVPSEDEWYKAAYYDTNSTSYFDYPAGVDAQTTCTEPGATANTANCDNAVFDLTDVGAYIGAASPGGTYDQGGNVQEWNEFIAGTLRGQRGGFIYGAPGGLAASFRAFNFATGESDRDGFRVASPAEVIPVPAFGPFGIAMLSSLLGLVGHRRLHTLAKIRERGAPHSPSHT